MGRRTSSGGTQGRGWLAVMLAMTAKRTGEDEIFVSTDGERRWEACARVLLCLLGPTAVFCSAC